LGLLGFFLLWTRRISVRKWLVLIAVVAGLTMDLMDLTIVNVAVPDIMTKFGSDIHLTQYVITGYMVTIGLFEPLTAFLADTKGTKRIYLLSLGIFTAGSALCAVAWNMDSLILFRVFQAIGGGMVMPLALSIVEKTFSKKEFPIAMGMMGIPLLLAPALGPAIGGYFVEYWNWRFIFWLNIPVGVIAIIASYVLLKEFATVSKKLDLAGFLLSAMGFSALLLAVSNGPTDGWKSLYIISLFIISGLTLLLFVYVELYSAVPLLDLRIFKNRVYVASTLVTFFMMMAMFGSLFLIPLFMQQLRGLGAMSTGMMLIPEVIGAAILLPISALLLPRVGATSLTIIGLAIMTVGMYPLFQIQTSTSLDYVRLQLFVVGGGLGFGLMPAFTMAYTVLPPPLVNQGSAFLNMMRQIGSALGVAILTSVIQEWTLVYYDQLSSSGTSWSRMGILLSQLTSKMKGQGYPPDQAHSMALGYIVNMVQQQAGVLAFHKAFATSAILGVIAVVPAIFLFRGKRSTHDLGSKSISFQAEEQNDREG
jgi:DHA2 family multidrug resistance protein